MNPHSIIIRKTERQNGVPLVFIDEVVNGDAIPHVLRFDEVTFSELQEILRLNPFPKKATSENVVLFRSLDTPLDGPHKFLGLQIVNRGSRHYEKIRASEEAFRAMKGVLDRWSQRMERFGKPTSSSAST